MRYLLVVLVCVMSCSFSPDGPGGTNGKNDGGTQDGCPSECSRCETDGGACVIECGAGECQSGVRCPSGRPCQIDCKGDNACQNALVDCTSAAKCSVSCDGKGACNKGVSCAGSACSIFCRNDAACGDGPVTCTASVCRIDCIGENTCYKHVFCNTGSCDIHCDGMAACGLGVCCNNNTCTPPSQVCTATDGGLCDCVQ